MTQLELSAENIRLKAQIIRKDKRIQEQADKIKELEAGIQQTAVDWLFDKISDIRWISYAANCEIERSKMNKFIQQAKKMEKQQIIFHSIELCKLLLSNPIEKKWKATNGINRILF